MTDQRVLIGALSFEQRCTSVLSACARGSDPPQSVILFDYGSQATSGHLASAARDENWRVADAIAANSGISIKRMQINPYSMGDAERAINTSSHGADLILDLTCLTKPHLLAAAQYCAKLHDNATLNLGYTAPWSYGDLNSSDSNGGWRDTLLLPLGDDPSFSNEGLVLGLFVPGSESSRAKVAFDEIEPATGAVIRFLRDSRPDVYRATFSKNEMLLDYLKMLRVPGPLGHNMSMLYPWGRWIEETVGTSDAVRGVVDIVAKLIASAKRFDAPIVLYPFGPTIVVFVSALTLAMRYPEASWAVYPIARTHTIDYSDGSESVQFWEAADLISTVLSS